MYHHVCALYNELGSGRFFCPREACQLLSNGSGQLPHASAGNLIDTPLGEYLTAKAQSAASSGLQIIVKVVVSLSIRPCTCGFCGVDCVRAVCLSWTVWWWCFELRVLCMER